MTMRGAGAWMGVALRDPTAEEVARWQLPSGAVIIEEVSAGSPAWRMGLRARDAVTRWDGEIVRGTRDLSLLIRDTPPGWTVTVTVAREGVEWDASLTPEASPQEALAPPTSDRASAWS